MSWESQMCCVQLGQQIHNRYNQTKTLICSISLLRSIPMIGQGSIITISNLEEWMLSAKKRLSVFLENIIIYATTKTPQHTSFQKWLEGVMLTSFQKAMQFLFQHLKVLCLGAQGQWENFAAALEKFVACVSLVGKLREVSAKQISIFLSEQPFVRN